MAMAASLATLDLPHLPIADPAFAHAPDGFMLGALAQHPWLARCDQGIVITEYGACTEILGMDRLLETPARHIVEIMGGAGTNWARFQVEGLIARSGADHDRMRGAVSRAFLPAAVKTYDERIRRVVRALLAEWADREAFDFAEFASWFPVGVMFGLVGVPLTRIAEVKDLLETVGQSFSLDPALFPSIRESFDALWAFVDALVVERQAQGNAGEPDLLDRLIEAEGTGGLSSTELRDLVLFLFVAGYDTSKNQLSHIVNLLLDRPDLWVRCASDRSFCDRIVSEALRHSGVATSYRNVAVEFEYCGVTMPQGTMLIFPMGIVCRYSGPFEDGRTFDPERSGTSRHTAFGRGMHICLGQFLARLQIAEGLHLIADAHPHLRRDGPVAWRPFPGVWGPLRLPVVSEN